MDFMKIIMKLFNIQEVNWSDIGHKFKLLKDHEAVL